MLAIFLWQSTYRSKQDIEVNKIKCYVQSQQLSCTCRQWTGRVTGGRLINMSQCTSLSLHCTSAIFEIARSDQKTLA